MNNSFKISIIIPNYNGLSLLEKNLPYVVRAKNNKRNNILEIILVDDGSIDSSVEFIKKNFKEIKIVKHKVNRGFSASVNTGARTARGDLLALLNNDVLPSANFLETAFSLFENPDVFAVSFNEKNYGGAIGYFENGFVGHRPSQKSTKAMESFWANGGSGLFRREFWMKLGGMDEKLFSPFYWEDVDLCYRALKRGWLVLWNPSSKVVHNHESTIGKINKKYRENIQERGQLLFIWKNITSTNLFRKHLAGLVTRITKHPGYIKIFFMALGKIGLVFKARRKEIKESKISDEAIFSKFR